MGGQSNCVRHIHRLPARSPSHASWPGWVPAELVVALANGGVSAPWPHQVRVAEIARRGQSVIMATGTASGKSLAYQLALVANILSDARARVLYLAPTKALAADQLRALNKFGLPGVRAATLDGDTPHEERDWVCRHANVILTNPDMLHHVVLPHHQKWAGLLRHLTFVVVDESHHYRGVFGSHVALVLRRLQRLAAHYGSTAVFIFASATSANPAESAGRLIGTQVLAVTQDCSPSGTRNLVLWEPRAENRPGNAPRRSAGAEAAVLLAQLMQLGARTLAFLRSQRGAEQTALATKRHLQAAGASALTGRVAAYRSGLLAEERRAIEKSLGTGQLLGVASTNALELGIDITGLDAVLIAGYPGSIASLWQRSGRAGRRGQDALSIFIAQDDPLDSFLVRNPAALVSASVEATVTDPTNPHVLEAQLACAAAESPLTPRDMPAFGGADIVQPVLDRMVGKSLLRSRPSGYYWTGRLRPTADIRTSAGPAVAVIDHLDGSLLGTVDLGKAPSTVHPGAVYLHQGRSYVVETLDLADGSALVRAENPDWTTTPQIVADIEIRTEDKRVQHQGVSVHFGTVCVSRQVLSYQRRRFGGQVIDQTPLDMPVQQLVTKSVWLCIEEALCESRQIRPADLPGCLHAAEHAAIGLLPLFAPCDRTDIGGVSSACHRDTGLPTVYVYDGHPGGAGYAARAHLVLGEWLRATRSVINACACESGCPSCVQSPQCGNGNSPLNKVGATILLDLVLAAIAEVTPAAVRL